MLQCQLDHKMKVNIYGAACWIEFTKATPTTVFPCHCGMAQCTALKHLLLTDTEFLYTCYTLGHIREIPESISSSACHLSLLPITITVEIPSLQTIQSLNPTVTILYPSAALVQIISKMGKGGGSSHNMSRDPLGSYAGILILHSFGTLLSMGNEHFLLA